MSMLRARTSSLWCPCGPDLCGLRVCLRRHLSQQVLDRKITAYVKVSRSRSLESLAIA